MERITMPTLQRLQMIPRGSDTYRCTLHPVSRKRSGDLIKHCIHRLREQSTLGDLPKRFARMLQLHFMRMFGPSSQRLQQFRSSTPLSSHQKLETEPLSISTAEYAKFLRNFGGASQYLRLLLRGRRVERPSSLANITVKVRCLIDLIDVKAAD